MCFVAPPQTFRSLDTGFNQEHLIISGQSLTFRLDSHKLQLNCPIGVIIEHKYGEITRLIFEFGCVSSETVGTMLNKLNIALCGTIVTAFAVILITCRPRHILTNITPSNTY